MEILDLFHRVYLTCTVMDEAMCSFPRLIKMCSSLAFLLIFIIR